MTKSYSTDKPRPRKKTFWLVNIPYKHDRPVQTYRVRALPTEDAGNHFCTMCVFDGSTGPDDLEARCRYQLETGFITLLRDCLGRVAYIHLPVDRIDEYENLIRLHTMGLWRPKGLSYEAWSDLDPKVER